MERIWDVLLFGLACLAGAMLFSLGVRRIGRRRGSRFCFYLSLVLLSLGALCGCTRVGKQPPVPPQASASASPSATPSPAGARLGDLQAAYDKLRQASAAKQSPEALRDCESTLKLALETVTSLHEARALQQEEAQFLSAVFQQLWEQARDLSQGRQEEHLSLVTRCLRDVNAVDQILMHVNANQHFDAFLAGLLKDQVRISFQALREVPLAERLSSGKLSREQYRELACRVQDNLFLYHQKSVATQKVSRPTPPREDPHRAVCEYGVREMPAQPDDPGRAVALYSVRRFSPPSRDSLTPPPAVVAEVRGEVWQKLTGKNWGRLTVGSPVTSSCVLENRGAQGASLTLRARGASSIEAQGVLTGWEIESARDDLQ